MKSDSCVIVWDWDGTLVNTRPVYLKTFEALAQNYPCSYFNSENFERLLKNWGAFWEACPLPNKEEAMYFYGNTYKARCLDDMQLMPEAHSVLMWAQKKGFRQIVVSNKVHWAIENEVRHFELEKYFCRCVGVERGLHPAKKPSLLYGQKALEGLSYDQLIVIGDSADDITFAENLNALSVYVCETPDKDLQKKAHLNADSLKSVKKLLTEQLERGAHLKNTVDGYFFDKIDTIR